MPPQRFLQQQPQQRQLLLPRLGCIWSWGWVSLAVQQHQQQHHRMLTRGLLQTVLLQQLQQQLLQVLLPSPGRTRSHLLLL